MQDKVRYAGFTIRFIASLYDTLILALPIGVVIYYLSDGQWFDFTQYQKSLQMAMDGNIHALEMLPQNTFSWEIIFEISVLGITLLFWNRWRGATPGKKIVGIKIVDAHTLLDISNTQALTRSLGYIPSTLLFGLGFLMIIFTKKKQGLHDIIADTVVIHT